MTRRFLGALQFLTVLPIPGSTASPGESAVFFPLVGALLGASAGLIPNPLLAIVWLLVITGCLHEDGLADVADAIRAGRTRERMLAILKDSRIGTYGTVALIVSFTTRWQALWSISHPIVSLAVALALSRTSLVVLAWHAAPIAPGMGEEFIHACSTRIFAVALAQAFAIAAVAARYTGWRHAIALLISMFAITALARWYFHRRLGGINGDCLGATCQAVEISGLLLLAWHPSF